ncbi:unnamed protein product [Leptosia nina]|uniref:Uncharacterized protein n=1 Tax=Leptosia nina TaxID=320188 RepID=A0AAV1J2Y2_9NEOP
MSATTTWNVPRYMSRNILSTTLLSVYRNVARGGCGCVSAAYIVIISSVLKRKRKKVVDAEFLITLLTNGRLHSVTNGATLTRDTCARSRGGSKQHAPRHVKC